MILPVLMAAAFFLTVLAAVLTCRHLDHHLPDRKDPLS